MRKLVAGTLYTLFPFDLKGDCVVPPARGYIRISCIINFYGRLDLLSGILHSLAAQEYERERFEVLLVEDQGGTDAGRDMAEEFASILNVVYLPLDANFGRMGYSRNFGLQRSRGDIVLFLDDDTVILQSDFLATLEAAFTENSDVDALVPHGHSSFACIEDRYDFHDPYFMTSRCTAYKRKVLQDLGGFMDHFVGQEDVEFVIRFSMSGKNALNVATLNYYHPPLLVPTFRKPQAVGSSFYQLRSRYPLLLWLLLLFNCSRHAPLYLLPVRKFREMGRFGVGFLMGVLLSPFTRKGFRYG